MTTHPYRQSIPADILALSHERDLLRRRGQYARADLLKQQIEAAGYLVKDNPRGAHLTILPSVDIDGQYYRIARQIPSLLHEPDTYTFSVNILAQNALEGVRRCVESVLHWAGKTPLEIILVDNASQDGTDQWAERLQIRDERLHLLRTSRPMGAAEARNVGLKRSRGRYILLLDADVELTGDIFTPLAQTLSESTVGITGMRGFRTSNLRHFEESHEVEVEVIDSTCMAFKRSLLTQAGLFDEHYRFPQYMDIDFCFAARAEGAQVLLTPDLPLIRHTAGTTTGLSDAERARLGKRNFYRFLEKWGDRDDLLLEEWDDGDDLPFEE